MLVNSMNPWLLEHIKFTSYLKNTSNVLDREYDKSSDISILSSFTCIWICDGHGVGTYTREVWLVKLSYRFWT